MGRYLCFTYMLYCMEFGMNHLTVVPCNFVKDKEEEEEEDG